MKPLISVLGMEIKDETGSFGKIRINTKFPVHIQCHLTADRQTEAVARGEVADFHKRFEYIFTLLRDNGIRVPFPQIVVSKREKE